MALNLISQLAHVEILSPKPDASLKFLTEVLGLEVSDRRGQSVFLRGWGEFFHHSLQLTEGKHPGLGHIAWRAFGETELSDAVARIEARGSGIGWMDGHCGHGPSYRYRGPGGHVHEIFWEVEHFKAPKELSSTYPNRAQRFRPRGVAARQIDHVTIATKDVMEAAHWHRDVLGHRFMEYTVPDDNPDLVVFAMTTTCERGHDLGLLVDFSGIAGRIHHVAYWVDQRQDLLRAAEVLLDADVPIEFGPGRHGMGEQDYLYFREPGGMRFELNSGGYKNYAPDWQTVRWRPSQGSNVFYRNLGPPPAAYREAFPSEQQANLEDVKKDGLFV
jgi:catechol 2,3-dioxygenase